MDGLHESNTTYHHYAPAVRTETMLVEIHEVSVPGMEQYIEISKLIYSSMGRRFGPLARLREVWRWLTGRTAAA